MSDQGESWSRVADSYETEFIDPYLPEVCNPLPPALTRLAGDGTKTAADLGCGVGPLLPLLAKQFRRVIAVDFAEGMLARARERCAGLTNIEFLQCSLTNLASLTDQVDVAIAVNSLVLPDIGELELALQQIHTIVRAGGRFLGIVPAMDAVHYFTMIALDRARRSGMPIAQARKNAARHVDHELYDFAFGDFCYQGIEQHFWQPFEVRYRLQRAGFQRVRLKKVRLAWHQFGCTNDFDDQLSPWDWFFLARKQQQKSTSREGTEK